VSTIAAGYPDKRHYPYAVTKAKAEPLVRESGLAHTIIRPTLVLGARSPIWHTLRKIAKLPVLPLPQSRRPVSVQPIHADDVARGIAMVLESGRFESEVLELGGPRPLPFAEFIEIVQIALRGEAGRIVRVPIWPMRSALALMEPALRPLMPVTAGQLALFANDSTASENWLLAQLRAGMPTVEAMIADLVDLEDASSKEAPATRPIKRRSLPMTDGARIVLEQECRKFAACLVRAEPSAYVIEQYAKAAHRHGLAFDQGFTRFDRIVLWLARKGPLLTRCADAYCALFHRRGALRRKLIVLAAILEHVAPTNEAFDVTPQCHPAADVLRLAAYSLTSGGSLVAGAVVLLPASILCWIAKVLGGERRPSEAG